MKQMDGVDTARNALISTLQDTVNGSRRLENAQLKNAKIFIPRENVHSGIEVIARMRDVE